MADGQFFGLGGRVAIVTGGGQGIGEAICRRLAAAGAKVAVFDLSKSNADTVAAAIGGLAVVGDVASEADIVRVVRETEAGLGPIDIVVNNAGITGGSAVTWEVDRDTFAKVLDINVLGPFLLCKHTVQRMIERKFGRIINIASVAGKEGNPTMGPYSASKAAVIGFTKSLARELVGKGDITANSIAPAVIATPILEQLAKSTVDFMLSKIPMGRPGKPEEVAALVHFLASSDCSFTTGFTFDISGGRATY